MDERGLSTIVTVAPEVRQDIISISGEPAQMVDAVLAGFGRQIRKQGDERLDQLSVVLIAVAQSYGAGKEKLPQVVIMEAIRFILEKFGHLSVQEIPVAFRMFAAGEITPSGAEMYRGEFSVVALGRILTAYDENRKKVVAAIYKKNEEMAREREEKERAEKLRAAYEEGFLDNLMSYNGSWQEVPLEWYETANRRGLIQWEEGEKKALWEKAQEMADQAIKAQRAELTAKDPMTLKIALGKLNPEMTAANIAKRIALYTKLIKPGSVI